MSADSFWDNREQAQKLIEESNSLRSRIDPLLRSEKQLEDFKVMAELGAAEPEAAQEAVRLDLERDLARWFKAMEALELRIFLNGPHDKSNCIFSINAGAGGTESCDWADMLLRMYSRWAERRGFAVDVQEALMGDEAGITHATMLIKGENAFGFAKAERGVHRLVRISPFDSNKRRHTSFCAIDIVPELEDDAEIVIKDEEVRIDTYRSSGKGGQHTQKNDTAVRITHLPTGLVASCENERSQGKNKDQAFKALKARLYEKREDEKRTEQEKYYGEKGDIGWGNQIRSYVFQPYQMVKDLRTGVETGNIQAVMDGDLDRFINGWLRAGSPRHRNKDVKVED
jgi:peptide chain release factor 2